MALRREDLTPDQVKDVEACERSAQALERDLSDPEFRGRLVQASERLAERPRAPRITSTEFLEQTAYPER